MENDRLYNVENQENDSTRDAFQLAHQRYLAMRNTQNVGQMFYDLETVYDLERKGRREDFWAVVRGYLMLYFGFGL